MHSALWGFIVCSYKFVYPLIYAMYRVSVLVCLLLALAFIVYFDKKNKLPEVVSCIFHQFMFSNAQQDYHLLPVYSTFQAQCLLWFTIMFLQPFWTIGFKCVFDLVYSTKAKCHVAHGAMRRKRERLTKGLSSAQKMKVEMETDPLWNRPWGQIIGPI